MIPTFNYVTIIDDLKFDLHVYPVIFEYVPWLLVVSQSASKLLFSHYISKRYRLDNYFDNLKCGLNIQYFSNNILSIYYNKEKAIAKCALWNAVHDDYYDDDNFTVLSINAAN